MITFQNESGSFGAWWERPGGAQLSKGGNETAKRQRGSWSTIQQTEPAGHRPQPNPRSPSSPAPTSTSAVSHALPTPCSELTTSRHRGAVRSRARLRQVLLVIIFSKVEHLHVVGKS